MPRRLGIRIAAFLAGFTLLQAPVRSDAGAQEAPPNATTETISVPGLDQSVEILKDRWGIAHIYAETEHDLFFAQGYSTVRDGGAAHARAEALRALHRPGRKS